MTWLEKRGGAAARVITKVSEAQKMVEEQEVVVLGFFGDLEGEEAGAFREAADKVDEAFFLLTADADVRKHYEVGGGGGAALVLLKDFDEGRVLYDGDSKDAEVSGPTNDAPERCINDGLERIVFSSLCGGRRTALRYEKRNFGHSWFFRRVLLPLYLY